VTTLGANGSRIKTKNKVYKINPAKPKNTSDPTGAGDAYRAGFIKGIVEKWPLDIVGRFAGVIACYTVEKYGTQTHKFSFEDAKKRYRENFGEELWRGIQYCRKGCFDKLSMTARLALTFSDDLIQNHCFFANYFLAMNFEDPEINSG